MIKVKRQQVRKKKVEDLFNSLKKDDLLEDRVVYSEEDQHVNLIFYIHYLKILKEFL